MTNIQIYNTGAEYKTSSKNVADVFGKIHRDVLRDIAKLDCSEGFRVRNFAQSTYISEQNKVLPCVEMTKDGFTFLCMGYRGESAAKFKESYIAEFNRMASVLNSVSEKINKLEADRKQISDAGRQWSAIGHEIRAAKKKHQDEVRKAIDAIQLKICF